MAKSKQEVTLTDDGREATVVKSPAKSFEERTAQGQPWRNKDGSENRGVVVEYKPTVEGK